MAQYQNEEELLRAWARFINLVAADVWSPESLGMNMDDVIADLQVTLLEAARRHLGSESRWPRAGFVKTVLRRRVMVLNRNSRSAGRDTDRMPVASATGATLHWLVEQIPAPDDTELETEGGETRQACLALLDHLQSEMRPRDFALLYLRFVEDLGPCVIAGAISDEQRRLGARLLRARKAAQRTLTEQGVWSWRDVEEGVR